MQHAVAHPEIAFQAQGMRQLAGGGRRGGEARLRAEPAADAGARRKHGGDLAQLQFGDVESAVNAQAFAPVDGHLAGGRATVQAGVDGIQPQVVAAGHALDVQFVEQQRRCGRQGPGPGADLDQVVRAVGLDHRLELAVAGAHRRVGRPALVVQRQLRIEGTEVGLVQPEHGLVETDAQDAQRRRLRRLCGVGFGQGQQHVDRLARRDRRIDLDAADDRCRLQQRQQHRGHRHAAQPELVALADRDAAERDMRQRQRPKAHARDRHRLPEPGRSCRFETRDVVVERDQKRQCRRQCDQHRQRHQGAFEPCHVDCRHSEPLIKCPALLQSPCDLRRRARTTCRRPAQPRLSAACRTPASNTRPSCSCDSPRRRRPFR